MNEEPIRPGFVCANCGAVSPATFNVCPNCGAPLNGKGRIPIGWLLALVIIAIPLALLGGSCLVLSISQIHEKPHDEYIGISWMAAIISAGLLLIAGSL